MQKIKLKNKNYSVGIFISNEGYGHSVRQKNIIIELINKYPKSSFTIFNYYRLSFLKEYFGNKMRFISFPDTLSTIKKKNGELDLKKTKKIIKKWPQQSKKKCRIFSQKKI